MPKYKVKLINRKIVREEAEVVVEAKDKDEAWEVAFERECAGDIAWTEVSEENIAVELDTCEEIEGDDHAEI